MVQGRVRTLGVVAAATLPIVLYLLYVLHYSVNVPYADDWRMVSLVHSALHGHINASEFWFQWADTRLFVPAIVFVLFAFVDHLNLQLVILFAAVVFVASYILLLQLLRHYLREKLTVVPVLAVGVTWLSLADVQNALWSFQLAWYLATFFFVATIFFLLVPTRRRTLSLGFGVVMAVAGSYSIVQGFAIWPVGVICLLWNSPWTRRTYYEVAAWVGAAVVVAMIYLRGFQVGNVECPPHETRCTLGSAILHPVLLFRYVALLVGNVVPTSFYAVHPNLRFHELLGVAILVVAGYVVAQTIRERHSNPSPLPLLLVAFGLLFTVAIALGRVGGGLAGALNDNRFVMPSLIVLVGIVIFACAHVPRRRLDTEVTDRRRWTSFAVLAMLGAFLIVQCGMSTDFGIVNGRTTHQAHETDAGVVVNLYAIPPDARGCDAAFSVFPDSSPPNALALLAAGREDLRVDGLSVLAPSPLRRLSRQGPPGGRGDRHRRELRCCRRTADKQWLRRVGRTGQVGLIALLVRTVRPSTRGFRFTTGSPHIHGPRGKGCDPQDSRPKGPRGLDGEHPPPTLDADDTGRPMGDLITATEQSTRLASRYRQVRDLTEALAAPLSPEDQTVQSMPDVSPTKWHRAHTSWFFETFLLESELSGYRPFHPAYAYLFNSYYEGVGARYPRPRARRGVTARCGRGGRVPPTRRRGDGRAPGQSVDPRGDESRRPRPAP